MAVPRALVAGNWKMNGITASLSELQMVCRGAIDAPWGNVADIMICPPATLIFRAATIAYGTPVKIGAQDCHAKASGAHTGDLSAEILKDTGASAIIVGHSERRTDHGETDAIVRAKALAAHRAGTTAIICIGETAEQRQAGRTLDVVLGQLTGSVPDGAKAENTVIAYEPVWAIGSGLTPTPKDVGEVHQAIRKALTGRIGAEGAGMRILYGGSVKASNAGELMRIGDVNGALVGGASLKAADFLGILAAYKA